MKSGTGKRIAAIAQAAVLLAAAVSILAAASYAWFVSGARAGPFEVHVIGQRDFTYAFYRYDEQSGAYFEVPPENAVGLTDSLVPGESARYRVEVKNTGSAAKLSVEFTGISGVSQEDGSPSSAFSDYLYVLVTQPVESEALLLPGKAASAARFRLASGIPVAKGGVCRIDYEFFLHPAAPASAQAVRISASGVTFTMG